MHTRRTTITLALCAALLAPPVTAAAQDPETFGGTGDNVAVAISTRDGETTFTVSFRIVRTASDVVENGNIAFSFSSCEGCESVAIAFQVVLVTGSPTTVSPENYAIALNFECVDCETLASAFQFVLGTDGQVHFTAEGNVALAEIRRRLRELGRFDLSLEQIQAELDLLAEDLRTVLAEELETAGPPDVVVEEMPSPTAGPSPSVAPSTSPEADPEPTSTATPSSSPEPTGTPGPTPSGTATPAPSPTTEASPTPAASVGS